MFILTALTAVVIGLSLWILARVIRNMAPNEKRINADLEAMKREVEPFVSELVPIGKEELELFSMSQVNQLLKKGVSTTARGVFTTIYNEPVVAYSYKKYPTRKNIAVLYARTAHHEMAYFMKGGEIKLIIDDQVVGKVKEDGILYGARSNRLLAQVNKDLPDFLPVIVKDKEVGSLVKATPTEKNELSQRAFEFVKSDLTKEEEAVFLSLAVLELVQRTVGEK